MRLIIAAAVIATLACASVADASPITYNFSITGAIGEVTGSFTGDDTSLDGHLTADELTSFTATATADGLLPPEFTISVPGAAFVNFDFDIATLTLSSLFVTEDGNEIACDASCTAGQTLNMLTNISKPVTQEITAATATPAPEPTSLLLFGSGFSAAIMRLLRRRKA
jgi:hypothetical protein